MEDHLLLAFSLTLFAGLSTGIGSAIAFLARTTNEAFLCATLSFSGGAMIYVSFIEIFPKAHESLADDLGGTWGYILTTAAFFGGLLLVAVIDKFVPEYENPHEMHHIEEMDKPPPARLQSLYRMGILTAFAIALHNFPEGLATFIATLKDPGIGIPVALAIAVHNIPEGIAISVPIYYATGSRRKAFMYSFLSGLAEPIGAAAGYVLLVIPFAWFRIHGGLYLPADWARSLDALPPNARAYLDRIEELTGTGIDMVSVGTRRSQIIRVR